MDLDAVAEGIPDKEALPGRGPAFVDLDAGSTQPCLQSIHVPALQAEMPLGVRSTSLLLDGKVKIETLRIKPDSAPGSKRLRFGNFPQSKLATVEGPGEVFATFGHGDVDVGKSHGFVGPFAAMLADEWGF